MKDKKDWKLADSFSVVARADGKGIVHLISELKTTTSDGWAAIYSFDGVIEDVNGAADENALKRIEASFSETIGKSLKETFTAFAASINGEEYSKTDFNGISQESKRLRYKMGDKVVKPFSDFNDSVREILKSEKASMNGMGQIKIKPLKS